MKNLQAHKRDDIQWNGYDMEELRYQRAYTLAKLEIQKEKLTGGFRQIYDSSAGIMGNGIMKKMISGLSYFDYAILAFRLGKRVYKMFRK